VRIAVTASRALGGAVVRSRAKRRVREAFRIATTYRRSEAGIDLVVTARAEAFTEPFLKLRDDAAAVLIEASR